MASPKTVDGIEKPLGVWDYEGCYSRFKTLGAKRYMTEKDGKISITIAGVSKVAGVRYLKYKYGSNDDIFEGFTDNLYFPATYDNCGIEDSATGKMCHTYIDDDIEGDIIDYMGNKYHYKEKGGVHLENTDYSLGVEDNFMKLLLGVKENYIIC